MALNKVEICGVNTSKLPILKAEEKEELYPKNQGRRRRSKRTIHRGKPAPCLKRNQTFPNSNENADDLFPDRLYRPDEGNRQL